MLNHDSSRRGAPEVGSQFSGITNSATFADPITIRIGRRGVVGLSGRIISIGVDGAWSVSKFANGHTASASASGRLSVREMRFIAGILSDNHHGFTLSSLPSQIGSSHINCPIASISSGQISKIAYIEINSAKTPTAPAARAFSDIVSAVVRIVGA